MVPASVITALGQGTHEVGGTLGQGTHEVNGTSIAGTGTQRHVQGTFVHGTWTEGTGRVEAVRGL